MGLSVIESMFTTPTVHSIVGLTGNTDGVVTGGTSLSESRLPGRGQGTPEQNLGSSVGRGRV